MSRSERRGVSWFSIPRHVMLPFALYNGSLFMARCMVGSAMGLQPQCRTRSARGYTQSPGRDILKMLVSSVRSSSAYLLSIMTRLSFLYLSCRQWLDPLRFVFLPTAPQRMQQHRQLASYRYHGSFFGVFIPCVRDAYLTF